MSPRAPAGIVLSIAVLTACSASSRPDVTRAPEDGGGGGAGAGGTVGRDAVASDSPFDGAPQDARTTTAAVRFGIVPTPGDTTRIASETEALIDVLAAGSRGITFVRAWDHAMDAARAPNRAVWARLAKASSTLRAAGRSVLLTLALVDRVRDARPADLAGAWDSPEARVAVERLVDEAYGTFGAELEYLALGNEIDRWLSGAPAADRAAMIALVEHAVDYARAHPNRPGSTRLGVTVAAAGFAARDPDVLKLASLGDVIVTTYHPLDEGMAARPPGGIARDLDDLVAALPPGAASGAVVLQEIGYPSDEVAGGSDDKQAAFYTSFAQALLSRRARFPFVTAFSSDDPDDAGCAQILASYEATGPEARAALCSMGLRRRDGAEKAAWWVLLDAVATFASP